MAIVTSTLPRSAVNVVERALADGVARSSFSLPNIANAPRKSLFRAFPHRVAHLPLDVIRPYADLRKAAVDVGWRFLVQERRQRDAGAREEFVPIASVTVTETKDGEFKIGEFNEGPFVEGTEAPVRHAETLDVVRNGQFEAVLLLAPAVYVVALWLQGKVSDEDILIPISPSDAALAPLQPTTPRAFLAILHRLAQRVLRV
jgi:hypothetical protein